MCSVFLALSLLAGAISLHLPQYDSIVVAERLDSSVVVSKMSIISSRGDTLVFNTSNIKKVENDRLRDLLMKLPGLQIDHNRITLMGEDVKKILLNGKLVFGDNVSAPLDLILAAAVKEIDSFREYDRMRMIEADTLGHKQRVLDVKTKDGSDFVWELALMTDGGINLSDTKHLTPILGLVGKYSRYKDRQPGLSANVYAGSNETEGIIASTPKNTVGGGLDISSFSQFDNRRELRLSAKMEESQLYNGYSESSFIQERESFAETQRKNSLAQVSAQGALSKVYDRNSVFSARIDCGISSTGEDIIEDISLFHPQEVKTKYTNLSAVSGYSLDANVSYEHLFPANGGKLRAKMSIVGGNDTEKREYIDTSSTGQSDEWQATLRKTPVVSPSFSVAWIGPFIGKTVLTSSIAYDGRFAYYVDSWQDCYTGQQLPFSYDIFQSQSGFLLKSAIGFSSERLEIKGGFNINYYDNSVADKLTQTKNLSACYFHMSPEVIVKVFFPLIQADLRYNENTILPNALQLLDQIGFYNRFYMTRGNPDLSMQTNRLLLIKMSHTSFPISTVWNLYSSLRIGANSIENSITRLESDVYLDNSGYKLSAGSQIMRPENLGSSSQVIVGLNASKSFPDIFTITPRVECSYSSKPFKIADEIIWNITRSFSTGLDISTMFSDKIGINSSLDYSFASQYSDSNFLYHLNTIMSNTLLKWSLSNTISLLGSISVNYYGIKGMDYSNCRVLADLEIEYYPGKNRLLCIFVKGHDLFNNSMSETSVMSEDMFRMSHHSYIGRSLLFGCKYSLHSK